MTQVQVMLPVITNINFLYKQVLTTSNPDYEYSRAANPTRSALQNALASIENGARGFSIFIISAAN
jgi:cystathionine beta-lyase